MPTQDLAPAVKTVLCAIDLSSLTPHVLMTAAEVAQAYGAKLVVLHAVEIWDRRYDFVVEEMARRIELEARAKVQAELAHLGPNPEVPVEVQVVKGHGYTAISSAVKSLRPDLVVIGSHGRKGIDRILLGSVADRVLRQSPASVLVVRPPKNPDFYTIACAVDFSDTSRQALERALDLAVKDKVKAVKLIHVFEIPIIYIEAGMAYQSAFDHVMSIQKAEMEKFIEPYKDCGIAIDVTIEEGPTAPTILSFAERVGADLLVVGTHGRSRLGALLIGGISSKVVHRATMPVLAVKASAHYEPLYAEMSKHPEQHG
ncbi:MAG TPA: universal stress protein [Planctomycetota bacterium]|nr:universal stress protein [Planctomycetota bacterium]